VLSVVGCTVIRLQATYSFRIFETQYTNSQYGRRWKEVEMVVVCIDVLKWLSIAYSRNKSHDTTTPLDPLQKTSKNCHQNMLSMLNVYTAFLDAPTLQPHLPPTANSTHESFLMSNCRTLTRSHSPSCSTASHPSQPCEKRQVFETR
jgi:hypothetical protein